MTNASKLRAFAITCEHIAGLLPRWVSKNGLRKSEAEHFARQLKAGAEIALDVAQEMETTPSEVA